MKRRRDWGKLFLFDLIGNYVLQLIGVCSVYNIGGLLPHVRILCEGVAVGVLCVFECLVIG